MQTFRNYLLYMPALLLLLAACARDKGNYDYITLPDPQISNLDTVYNTITGDSLIIAPKIKLASGSDDYSCYWKIDVAAEARTQDYEGKELRIVFGLPAARYPTQLAVTDNTNGMKYFYNFDIVAQTEFTRGLLVLSNNQNQAVLSFVKPDGTIRPDIYNAVNGEVLPGPAKQLVPIQNMFYLNTLSAYWISYGGDQHGGVQVDASSLKRTKYMTENFYDQPASVQADYLLNLVNGTTTAIIGGKIYIGATETAPFWPYYGVWGVPITGSYNLYPQLMENTMEAMLSGKAVYFLGFDKNRKGFVRFLSNTYYDVNYTVLGDAFNPASIKMDMLNMSRFNDNEMYAIGDSAGKKLELKLRVDFTDSTQRIYPLYKRTFPGAGLLTADTKWQQSPIGVMFFSANDVVYRYNPLNSDIKPLETTTAGKKITMLKVLQNGNLLVVGAEGGSIYYLDISTGKQGQLIKKIDGLPGAPQDIILRD
ncbi:MAG TPA: PKD-like family lipoprotein [Chitinophaga sp.]|uniref:PKD-like family lipoprotein n=1 Tax=Chitinophaga sp. TaxID=1869181 RepID=UPI002DB99EC0|nr:PKD-like family lipoprotein [Chitinophaga sp.]HEU4554618.1 PKD-like family lipoprotein [Chitinophaga sp.]